MSAPVVPVQTDRSDFRTVVTHGAKLGAITAVAVVAFSFTSRLMGAGLAENLVQSAIVLVAGVLVAFLPGYWVGARTTEGVAGAAAVGLVGTAVFTIIDVAVLRPTHVYPWTWDAIGGGSGWWYLPVWWMYGTFLSWMGGLVVAGKAGAASLGTAAPPALTGIFLAAAAHVLGCPMPLAFLTGSGFTLGLVGFALLGLRRT